MSTLSLFKLKMLTLYYLMKKSKKDNKSDVCTYYYDLQKDGQMQTKASIKCRICLQKGCVSILHDASVKEALEIFGGIRISAHDDFPKYLCSTCHKFVEGAIMFRKIAKKTDVFLKQTEKKRSLYDQNDYAQDQDFSDNSLHESKPSRQWPTENSCTMKTEKMPKIKQVAKVTCNVCHKVVTRSYYKEHMTMHDPDHKKYVCDVCGMSFRLRCAYHNHSLRHRNDFPFKCQFCPYKGKYAELLKTHMRTHTGDYRYMCTECPARFLFKSNLNSHMLKHKEPQFRCDSCKRAFHTKLQLQRHFEADHLGIKNHCCKMCGKAFGYRNAMMKHQRRVHKREKMLSGRMPSYLEAERRQNHDKL